MSSVLYGYGGCLEITIHLTICYLVIRMHVTNVEKCFVLEGLNQGYRTDGRALHVQRSIEFEFGTKDEYCVARLGDSVACACITGTLERPQGGRPSEGTVTYRVKNASKKGSKQHDIDSMMERFLERSLKESKAVDLESLCVQAGRLVWHIQVSLTIMSDDGNVLDVLSYAALGALRVFKRCDVSLDRSVPGGVKIHTLETKEGIPLTLHHFPITSTFACFSLGEDERQVFILDPTELEQLTSHGLLVISMTPQGDVCAVQKADGCGMSRSDVLWCMRMGMDAAKNVCQLLDISLQKHSIDRVAARIVRKRNHGEENDTVIRQIGSSFQASAGDFESLPDAVKDALKASQDPMLSDDECNDQIAHTDGKGPITEEKSSIQQQRSHPEVEDEENPSGWKERRYAKPDHHPISDDIYRQASQSVSKQAGHDADDGSLEGAFKT